MSSIFTRRDGHSRTRGQRELALTRRNGMCAIPAVERWQMIISDVLLIVACLELGSEDKLTAIETACRAKSLRGAACSGCGHG